jgi:tape measure domain-containing protein
MANKVTIDIEAKFADHVSGKTKAASSSLKDLEKNAKSAAKEVDNLSKKKAEPKLDADNSKLLKKTTDSTSRLKKLGSMAVSAKIKALDLASKVIDKVATKAKALANKTYSFLVKTRDSNALQSLTKISNAGQKIAGKTWTAAVKVKDLATAPLRGIKNMLFSIQSIVLAIGAGMAANKLIAEPIGVADAYSSAKIGFSTLIGESAGQQMMNDLDEFAKKTPFKTSGVIDSARKMMAMGWDTDNLLTDLEVFGNAAAATGNLNQGLESIVRAMSQIKTKGRLSTEELNQLAEAGIAAKAMLAENLGYGTGDEGIAKMTKDLEDGAIASNVAIEALIAGMKKYDGMMDSMANETAEGLMSQIQDVFEINVVRKWGQGLQDGAKRGLGAVVDLLDEAEEAMGEFGDMVYEVSEKASNWMADRFENAIQRITDITGTYEFQNADIGEKISMLWEGVIVDPLKEWWEGGGQQKTAETAGKIGSWMGKSITSGLLTIFGITDILDDETAKQLGESGGMSIAQSFAQGFKDNFDGSAITEAFVDAIGDVWGALPTWAKFMLGGYAAGKVAGGISSLAGGLVSGIDTIKNIAGNFDIVDYYAAGSAGSGILGTFGKAGATLGATTTGGAILMGGAGIAGGVAGGASLIKGGSDLIKSYYTDDAVEKKALSISGNSAIAATLGGAAIGTAIAPGIGTLIGAGIGGIAGWIGGNKWADSIRAAKFEAEGLKEEFKEAETAEEKLAVQSKGMWENARKHFGDIKLSMSEIQRMADQVVWGDDLGKFEQLTQATQAAENSVQQFKSATEQVNRWTWKASLGVKFNEDEKESIVAAFDEYVNSAKSVVENKHYEFTAAVGLLVDVESEVGKSIIDSGNEFYTGLTAELDTLQTELQTALDQALVDGVISADTNMKVKIGGVEVEGSEEELIAQIQAKIAEIEGKVAQAQAEAELESLKIKFGSGNLDAGSFDSFMQEITTAIEERMTANDTALTASIASLKLQLGDGTITQDEYDAQLQALVDGYNAKVDSIKAEVMDVELSIIGDAYEDLLGEDAKAQLATGLQKAIQDGISSAEVLELSGEQLANLINISPEALEASGFSADNIQSMLSSVLGQMEAIQVDTDLLVSIGATTVNGASAEDLTSAVQSNVPAEIPVDTVMRITPYKQCSQVDVLASDFGINDTYPHNLLWDITGDKETNTVSVTAGDFGIPNSIDHIMTINITGVPKYRGGVVGDGSGYRGGIFGGTSAMDAFARGGETDNSGIVGGSTRFIRVNEESPEMIIPLSSQRRERALKLWNKTGELLGVPGFFRGGRSDGNNDEGIRFGNYGRDEASGGQTVEIDVGGIHVEINVDATGTENIAEAIKKQGNEIAEVVAGIMADAIGGQYENTPLRGGIA